MRARLIALHAQRALVALGSDLGRIFLDTTQPSYVERVEAVFDELNRLREDWRKQRSAQNRLAALDPLRLENDPQISRQWLVDGWLPMGETCGLGGAGGEGKTLLAHQLATVSALGSGQWLGMRVSPMKAALVLCEDNVNDAHWRQVKINRLYGCSMEDLAGELFTLPRREADSNYLAVSTGKTIWSYRILPSTAGGPTGVRGRARRSRHREDVFAATRIIRSMPANLSAAAATASPASSAASCC
jgi:hypothetical protein